MKSAFGVEHHFSKSLKDSPKRVNDQIDAVVDENGQMSEKVMPVVPSTSVDVYNKTTKSRKRATLENWGAKLAGGAVGTAAGVAAYRGLKGRATLLKEATKYGKGKKKVLTAEKKQGLALAGLTSIGSSAGGYAGGRAHHQYVKNNPKYGYKEK